MLFSGSLPRFSGMCLASFAPRVRRNLRRSQVGRLMFSHTYPYRDALALQTNSACVAAGADSCSAQPEDGAELVATLVATKEALTSFAT